MTLQMRYNTFIHSTSLHRIAFHCITLPCTALHYIAYICTYIQKQSKTQTHIHTHTPTHTHPRTHAHTHMCTHTHTHTRTHAHTHTYTLDVFWSWMQFLGIKLGWTGILWQFRQPPVRFRPLFSFSSGICSLRRRDQFRHLACLWISAARSALSLRLSTSGVELWWVLLCGLCWNY